MSLKSSKCCFTNKILDTVDKSATSVSVYRLLGFAPSHYLVLMKHCWAVQQPEWMEEREK
jgi:hypothetical protein